MTLPFSPLQAIALIVKANVIYNIYKVTADTTYRLVSAGLYVLLLNRIFTIYVYGMEYGAPSVRSVDYNQDHIRIEAVYVLLGVLLTAIYAEGCKAILGLEGESGLTSEYEGVLRLIAVHS